MEGANPGNHFSKSWVDGEVTYGAATLLPIGNIVAADWPSATMLPLTGNIVAVAAT